MLLFLCLTIVDTLVRLLITEVKRMGAMNLLLVRAACVGVGSGPLAGVAIYTIAWYINAYRVPSEDRWSQLALIVLAVASGIAIMIAVFAYRVYEGLDDIERARDDADFWSENQVRPVTPVSPVTPVTPVEPITSVNIRKGLTDPPRCSAFRGEECPGLV